MTLELNKLNLRKMSKTKLIKNKNLNLYEVHLGKVPIITILFYEL